MKSFFRKKVAPPDIDTRNRLLRKLAILKGNKDPGIGNLKKALRRRLKHTDGVTEYSRYHKGVTIPLGDENTRKKLFLKHKNQKDMEVELRNLRSSKSIKSENKFKLIQKTEFNYVKIGGVLNSTNVFGVINKKIKRQKVFNFKPPVTPDFHIGIELEFASKLSLEDLADLIGEHNLQDSVRAMRDGSIRTQEGYGHQIELCVLTKWSNLGSTIQNLNKIISSDRFVANESCGLHVHLDARQSSRVNRMYENLVAVQSLLFSLVSESRLENEYCQPVVNPTWETSNPKNHYAAISSSSYFKHKTIEVRIHHSTIDLSIVEKWIRLLKQVADYSGGPTLVLSTPKHEFDQLIEYVKIEPELIQYIQERVAV